MSETITIVEAAEEARQLAVEPARAAYRRLLSGAADTCEGVCGRSYLGWTRALGDGAGPIAGVSESQST